MFDDRIGERWECIGDETERLETEERCLTERPVGTHEISKDDFLRTRYGRPVFTDYADQALAAEQCLFDFIKEGGGTLSTSALHPLYVEHPWLAGAPLCIMHGVLCIV